MLVLKDSDFWHHLHLCLHLQPTVKLKVDASPLPTMMDSEEVYLVKEATELPLSLHEVTSPSMG